jgi:hypothetical protein
VSAPVRDLVPHALPEAARIEVARAAALIERPSVAARIASVVGLPAQRLAERLPEPLRRGLSGAVQGALVAAAAAAERSAPGRAPFGLPPEAWQRGLVVASGALGGALGFKGTLAELPVTTTLLLRDVLAIAAEEEEPPAARSAEALKVFALGSRSAEDDTAGAGYFALRLALAEATPGMVVQAAIGALPGLVGLVAQRFTGPVATKLAAQAAPVLGAATGAGINLLFRAHYRDAARGHFLLRRLERTHGAEPVRAAYAAVSGLVPARGSISSA